MISMTIAKQGPTVPGGGNLRLSRKIISGKSSQGYLLVPRCTLHGKLIAGDPQNNKVMSDFAVVRDLVDHKLSWKKFH